MSRGVEGGYVSTGPALKLPGPGQASRVEPAQVAQRWRFCLFGSQRAQGSKMSGLARAGPGEPTRATVTAWPAGREGSGGACPAELGPGYWKLML
jgi:hypothetical protein